MGSEIKNKIKKSALNEYQKYSREKYSKRLTVKFNVVRPKASSVKMSYKQQQSLILNKQLKGKLT